MLADTVPCAAQALPCVRTCVSAPGPSLTCGDGVLDSGETCDDGNASGGDGCSIDCKVEVGCGDTLSRDLQQATDQYEFDAAPGEVVIIRTLALTNQEPSWSLTDANGDPGGGSVADSSCDASVFADCQKTVILAGTPPYTIAVFDEFFDSGGQYTLTLAPKSATFNGQPSCWDDVIACGETLPRSGEPAPEIDPEGAIDGYRFDAMPGEVVTIRPHALSNQEVSWQLTDANGGPGADPVADSSCDSSVFPGCQKTVTLTGVPPYTITLFDDFFSGTGSYTLTLVPNSATFNGQPSCWDDVIACGETLPRSGEPALEIDPDGDLDSYAFDAVPGTAVTIRTLALTNQEPSWSLTDANGDPGADPAADSSCDPSVFDECERTVTLAGTSPYTIIVFDQFFSGTGEYTLSLVCDCGDGTVVAPEECENDSHCAVTETCVPPGQANECTCVPDMPCGNGMVDDGEDCDGTECCDADCTFSGAGTPCNGGVCDDGGVCVTSGGAVFVTCHDADWHAAATAPDDNPTGARNINRVAIDLITSPQVNPFTAMGITKFLFVESNDEPQVKHPGRDGIVASGFVLDVDFEQHTDATLSAELDLLGTKYNALVVASDCGGILTQAELDILNARVGDIVNFVNAGGGLYALAESNEDVASGCSGALTPNGGHYRFVPGVAKSVPDRQTEEGNRVTERGVAIGLTDEDVNGNVSHCVLDRCPNGTGPVDLDELDRVLSCYGQTTLALCGDRVVEDAEECDDGSQCEDGSDCTSDPLSCTGIGEGTCGPRNDDGCSAFCTIESPVGGCEDTIDFERSQDRTPLPAGTIVFEIYGREGNGPIVVHGENKRLDDENAAVLFDSSCLGGCDEDGRHRCSGDPDKDLGSPNEEFGGPGEGDGGEAGEDFENAECLGNILIVAKYLDDDDEDGLVDDPNDQGRNKTVTSMYDFSAVGPVTIRGITFIDIDNNEDRPSVELFDSSGAVVKISDGSGDELDEFRGRRTDNNGVVHEEFVSMPGVETMLVTVRASGAIDNIKFELDLCEESVPVLTTLP